MIRFRLKAADGTLLSEKIVTEFPLTFGRNPTSGMSVGDAGVSYTHAELDWDGHHLHLRDVNSRNGTFVEGNTVTEMVLNLPCTFRLGKNVMVEAESAEAEVHKLPTVFRLATPKAAIPVSLPEPEVIDVEAGFGEEKYWHRLQNLSPRVAALFAIAATTLVLLVQLAVFRESLLGSLLTAFSALLGSLLFGSLLGALLALPGTLFQGKFNFKPLFLQLTASFLLMSIELALQPAILIPHADFVVRAFCLPLLLLVAVTGPYVFLFSTFPHLHAKRLFQVSLVLAVIASGGQVFRLVTLSQRALLRSAFLGTFHASRGLAGSAEPVSSVTDDLRAFGARR